MLSHPKSTRVNNSNIRKKYHLEAITVVFPFIHLKEGSFQFEGRRFSLHMALGISFYYTEEWLSLHFKRKRDCLIINYYRCLCLKCGISFCEFHLISNKKEQINNKHWRLAYVRVGTDRSLKVHSLLQK